MKIISPASLSAPVAFQVPGIYGIKLTGTRRIYVGSSINCRSRLWKHIGALIKGNHYSSLLQRTWNKYGQKRFELILLESVPNRKHLIKREQYWIDKLKSYTQGLNLRPRAEANYDIEWSPDQNARRKKSNVSTWSSEHLRQNLSKKFKGQRRGVWSASSHQKASKALKILHATRPQWRENTLKTLKQPEVEQKRLANMREALKRPEVYKARCTQLAEAFKSPKRLKNLRKTAARKKREFAERPPLNDSMNARIAELYATGLSARCIGRMLNRDHKSILRRMGLLKIKRRNLKTK